MAKDGYEITLMPGDGIGPEVIDAAVVVLGAAASRHGAGKGVANPVATILSAAMLLDYNLGRRGEVDAINGSIPRLGKQYGVPTPINETVVGIVKAREAGFPA